MLAMNRTDWIAWTLTLVVALVAPGCEEGQLDVDSAPVPAAGIENRPADPLEADAPSDTVPMQELTPAELVKPTDLETMDAAEGPVDVDIHIEDESETAEIAVQPDEVQALQDAPEDAEGEPVPLIPLEPAQPVGPDPNEALEVPAESTESGMSTASHRPTAEEERACSKCGGSGRTDCIRCNGDGNEACGFCWRSGTVDVTCRTCNGSGRSGDDVCGTCNGTRTVTEQCDNCGGRGVLLCGRCNGQATEQCSMCNGSGTSPLE